MRNRGQGQGIDDATRARIVKAIREGTTYEAIRERFGIGTNRLQAIAHEAGLSPTTKHGTTGAKPAKRGAA